MGKVTLSMAKNQLRKALLTVAYPWPSKMQIEEMRSYFKHCCAYCGVPIDPNRRIGHLDHIVSLAEGGTNNVHNLVLACRTCNGDEKREKHWEDFLREKCGSDTNTYTIRNAHVRSWIASAPVDTSDIDRPRIDEILAGLNEQIDQAAYQIKLIGNGQEPAASAADAKG